MKKRIPPVLSIVMAVVSFAVAAVPATGLVMKSDAVGRIIFTVAWVLVGIAWLGQLLHARKSGAHE
jgi:hypothetical protein